MRTHMSHTRHHGHHVLQAALGVVVFAYLLLFPVGFIVGYFAVYWGIPTYGGW